MAELDELARDKRLCGPTMKGLLTILHPPEALPAGHRLPECLSPSRPQSQHALLSLQGPHPTRPLKPGRRAPTQIVMQMIINVVMKVIEGGWEGRGGGGADGPHVFVCFFFFCHKSLQLSFGCQPVRCEFFKQRCFFFQPCLVRTRSHFLLEARRSPASVPSLSFPFVIV